MITKIQGRKYSFEVVSKNGEQNVCFYIRAICSFTGRTSYINNLNAILSEFGVDPVKLKFADSMWVVSRKKANYLEKRLDDDRLAGEWENITAI